MKLEKTFGDTVKKLREEKNLPLREVAEALNIDTSMLGKIEKNSRKPTKQIIEKFAAFFKVSGKDLKIKIINKISTHFFVLPHHFSLTDYKPDHNRCSQ